MKIEQKEVYLLLQPIVAAMNKTLVIKSVTTIVENGKTFYKLFTCNSLWITMKYPITINGKIYITKDIDPNNWIKVSGESLPVKGSYDISLPYFVHGTLLMQNSELKKKQTDGAPFSYLPMIYLHDITDEMVNLADVDDNSVSREAQTDLYFMTECNPGEWVTIDHFKYAIRPMRNMMMEFNNALIEHSSIGLIDSQAKQNDLPSWGIYTTDKGMQKKLIDDDLSGCYQGLKIPFLKDLDCDC